MLHTIAPSEMKRVETRAIKETGVTGETLMQRAAGHVAAAVRRHLPEGGGRVLALCGTGNNGGDGIAALRLLCGENRRITAGLWLLPGALTEDCGRELARLRQDAPEAEVRVLDASEAAPGFPSDVACLIDGLFGTGLSRDVTGLSAELCRLATQAQEQGVPVVAVDIPSGLHGETGQVLGAAVRATETVTFHRPKPGLFLGEGLNWSGTVTVSDIGIPPECDDAPGFFAAQEADMPRFFPPRRPATHKGSYGRVLAVAGCRGMAGAAAICALAALRTGAGLVTVACPEAIVDTVQQLCPCATCLPLPEDDTAAFDALLPALAQADALAVGCGLGTSSYAEALMARLIAYLSETKKPAVLDADGLNLLARRGLPTSPLFTENQILTPHPAEAARLLGLATDAVAGNAPKAARLLRERFGASVLLKGAASLLLADNREGLNLLGTPALAKGGSGDALTGVLAALLANRAKGASFLSVFDVLQAGAALHGLAARAAERRYGRRGVLATDVCDGLGMDF